MKSLKSKVILSAAVLLFALVATIGSTYAWFTVSSTNNVESMTLNVQSANSLLIRMYDPNGFVYKGAYETSDIAASSAPTVTVYTYHDDTVDYWTDSESTEYILSSGNLVEKLVPGNVEIAAAHLNKSINDATTYYTTLTAAQVQTYYAYTGWTLYPVTAVQGYASAALNGADLQKFDGDPLTDYDRSLTDIVAGDINNATGSVIQLKFWVLSQSAAGNMYVSNLDINRTGLAANTQYDEIINAVRLSVQVASGTGYVYSDADASNDYAFAFTSGRPGYYDGAENFSTAFNYIDSTFQTSLVAAQKNVADHFVVETLTADTPTVVTVTIYVEGWDAQTTNNIIKANFNILFSFSI